MVPQVAPLREELVGRSGYARSVWTALGIGEFLVLVVILAVDVRSGFNVWPRESQLLVWGGVGILLLLAAAGSYLHAGVLPSLAVCVLPIVALFLFILGDGMVRPDAGITFVVMRAIGFGLLFGLGVGIPGYLLGYFVRVRSDRSTWNYDGFLS